MTKICHYSSLEYCNQLFDQFLAFYIENGTHTQILPKKVDFFFKSSLSTTVNSRPTKRRNSSPCPIGRPIWLPNRYATYWQKPAANTGPQLVKTKKILDEMSFFFKSKAPIMTKFFN